MHRQPLKEMGEQSAGGILRKWNDIVHSQVVVFTTNWPSFGREQLSGWAGYAHKPRGGDCNAAALASGILRNGFGRSRRSPYRILIYIVFLIYIKCFFFFSK
jgi:hypothetical protein